MHWQPKFEEWIGRSTRIDPFGSRQHVQPVRKSTRTVSDDREQNGSVPLEMCEAQRVDNHRHVIILAHGSSQFIHSLYCTPHCINPCGIWKSA
jgi:hypothetical protein